MADISRLSRLLTGMQRQVALNTNTLVVDNLKIKMGSGNDANHATFSGSLTTARTISMPDANVDLGQIATNKTHVDGDGSDHQDVADLATLSGSAANSTNHGAFTGSTLSDTETTRSALQALETKAEANTTSISDHISDATGAHAASAISNTPAGSIAATDVQAALNELDTEKLALAGGTMSGAIAMGTNKITGLGSGTVSTDAVNKGQLDAVEALINGLEWQNSALDYVVDNTLAPATEVSGDRYILSHDGGAPHANWDGAFAGDIVEFNGTTWVATTPTTGMFISVDDQSSLLYYWGGAAWSTKSFEATTASGLLTVSSNDVQFATSTAANIIVYNGSGVASSVAMSDEATISNAGAVTLSNAAVIAKVLTGFTSGAGTVSASDSILGAIEKLDGNHAAHLADASDAHDASAISYDNASSGLTATDAQAALDEIEGRVDTLESDTSDIETLSEDLTAGETLTAGIRALRWAKGAETAGRVYLADKDASSQDDFHVMGLVVATGELAGAAINDVAKAGKMTATAHGFTVGEPIFLSSTGGLTNTAPSAANEAVVKVGMARDANTIEVQIQIMGVN